MAGSGAARCMRRRRGSPSACAPPRVIGAVAGQHTGSEQRRPGVAGIEGLEVHARGPRRYGRTIESRRMGSAVSARVVRDDHARGRAAPGRQRHVPAARIGEQQPRETAGNCREAPRFRASVRPRSRRCRSRRCVKDAAVRGRLAEMSVLNPRCGCPRMASVPSAPPGEAARAARSRPGIGHPARQQLPRVSAGVRRQSAQRAECVRRRRSGGQRHRVVARRTQPCAGYRGRLKGSEAGARSRTRTEMTLRSGDFESPASAISPSGRRTAVYQIGPDRGAAVRVFSLLRRVGADGPQVERAAGPVAVREGLDLVGRPVAHAELVRHDAGARA